MKVLRRRVRRSFLLATIGFLVIGLVDLSRQDYAASGISALHHYGFIAFYLLQGILYAAAWFTTKAPCTYRNNWAVVCSLFTLTWAGYDLYLHQTDLMAARSGFVGIVLAIAGLYVFGTGGTAPESDSAASVTSQPAPVVAKPSSIAGDRTHPWIRHLVTLVSLAGELGALYFWSIWASSHGLLQAHAVRLPWYLVFSAAVLISTILHECGHALLAWCFGMRVLSFNAGPLRWLKLEGKWGFRLDIEGLFNLGGAVRVVPTNPEQPRLHDILMVAAGPLANIITGTAFLFAALYGSWPHYELIWPIVALTASFSYIAAITNLFPFMTQDGGYSDGARILQIVTRSPLDDYHRTMNSLAATLVTPRRYRDLDINAIQRAAAEFPYTYRGFFMNLCASNYYLDAGRVPEARKSLTVAEDMVQQGAIDVPGPIHTALVFKQAYLNRNAAAARSWWDRMEAKGIKRKNFDYWLAKASLHWIEGNSTEAGDAWKTAEAEAAKLPNFGAYEMDRYRLSLLRQALDDRSRLAVRPIAASTPTAAPAELGAVPRAVRIRTAPTASSQELAAAAVSAEAPQEQRWDPLSFIRAATPEKSRA